MFNILFGIVAIIVVIHAVNIAEMSRTGIALFFTVVAIVLMIRFLRRRGTGEYIESVPSNTHYRGNALMRLILLFALIAMAGCSSHHELTACKGPYVSLVPPGPPASPLVQPGPTAPGPMAPGPLQLSQTQGAAR